MAEFNTKADVQAWVDGTENGAEDLRWALSIGTFNGQKQVMARAWLHSYELELAAEHEKVMRTAATDSAKAAKDSARAALIAVFCSVAALALAAWPYFAGTTP